MHKTPASAAPNMAIKPARPTFRIFAILTVVACLALAAAGYLQPVIMGVVQGLAEPLPISSSAHLILVPWLFGWEGGALGTLTFDVALHVGTFVALVAYFWRDWVALFASVPELARWVVRGPRQPAALSHNARLLFGVALATIPGAVAGLVLNDWAEAAFRSPPLIAFTLTIMGVLLYLADRYGAQGGTITQMTWGHALLIGIAQACALVPGVSRSGGTITMGRWLGYDRATAARFSFLLSMPITAAAIVFKLPEIAVGLRQETAIFSVGVLVSAAVGALAIHFLLGYVRRAGFAVFAIYRVLLAAIVLAVFFFRG